MLLLNSFFGLKELFREKNGLTTVGRYFFFFENAENLGRSDDTKWRKKRRWPYSQTLLWTKVSVLMECPY